MITSLVSDSPKIARRLGRRIPADALPSRVGIDSLAREPPPRSPSISNQSRVLLCVAALSLLIATIAGALGAHVLALDERGLRSFDSAVDFQFFHGLGLIGITLVGLRGATSRLISMAAWLMVAGTVLFCGSIYARSLGAPGGIVAAAPYGGVAFMVAWVLFAIGVWRSRVSSTG